MPPVVVLDFRLASSLSHIMDGISSNPHPDFIFHFQFNTEDSTWPANPFLLLCCSSVHGPLCTSSSVFPNSADWLAWTTVLYYSEWRQLKQSSFVGGLQGNPPQPGKIELTATSDIQEEWEDGRKMLK